jgi:hypothetical protein
MTRGSHTVLDRRRLNRALLERQMLAAPRDLPVPDAVERLVGLHAQLPNAPYVASLPGRVRQRCCPTA